MTFPWAFNYMCLCVLNGVKDANIPETRIYMIGSFPLLASIQASRTERFLFATSLSCPATPIFLVGGIQQKFQQNDMENAFT